MANTWNLGVDDAENELNTLLLVHNIHPGLNKQGLKSQFIRFGEVDSTNVMINSRGNPMGFVQMRSVRECNAAIAGLNCRAPLHWTVQMSAPQAERQRRRREREESRRFDEEMRPIHEAKLRELEEHEERMLRLTREFVDTLGTEEPQIADEAEEPDSSHMSDPAALWPSREGLRPCSVCTAPTPGFCQRCNIPYCSPQCQHRDWDKHRHTCGRREQPLVVSVARADAPEPMRSVRLGRGDQPRPVPASAPAPLRRPHSSSGGGDGGPTLVSAPSGGGDGPPGAAAARQLGPVHLLPGHNYAVVVCYAADPSAVYLRLHDQYGLVAEMEAELQRQVAPPAAPGSHTLEVGHLCAGRFQDSWYRGEILAVAASHCRVHFLDWGNAADLPPSDIASLPPCLSSVPPQAVCAALPWRPAGAGGSWSRGQFDGLAALDGQPLTASVVTSQLGVSVALFNEDGKSVLTVIGEGVKAEREEAVLPPQAQLEADRKHVVLPISMWHPQCVAAQLRDVALYRPYRALADRVQTAGESAAPLTAVPAAGTPVSVLCAPAGGSPTWHRAAVQGRDGGRAVLRLLDWGSIETAELAQLRSLPPHLCQTTAIGVQFGLHGVPETACPERELAFYREKLIRHEFLLEEVGAAEGVTQAKLHLLSDTNSYCFNDKMISRIASRLERNGAAVPVTPVTGSSPLKRCRLTSDTPQERPLLLADLADPPLQAGHSYPFFVGQVLSPSRFYGSLLTEENTAALDRAEAALQELMEQRPPPACTEPQYGQLVAVHGAEAAGGWCRAAVVDVSGPGVQVRLLDIGQLERVSVDRLRQMPPELDRLPPASLCLSIRGSERFSPGQRRLAEKVLVGDGEETVLVLTVASVGRAGAVTVVTCAEVDGLLGSPP